MQGKLASLGQLTAGIAHEIKNPLNFVNNFAALSAELLDELDEILEPVPLDGKTREGIVVLTAMLKGNLEKVVKHGKRADSIVKNMLLHSREGSGEHRLTEINTILDESLKSSLSRCARRETGFQDHGASRLRPPRRHCRFVSSGDDTRTSQFDLERILCCDET